MEGRGGDPLGQPVPQGRAMKPQEVALETHAACPGTSCPCSSSEGRGPGLYRVIFPRKVLPEVQLVGISVQGTQ